MTKVLLSLFLILAVASSAVCGFSTGATAVLGGTNGGSDFVVSQRPRPISQTNVGRSTAGVSAMRMGKMAKFGIFSPAVYGSKIVLGQDKLNKIRGKGISLHSQAIGEFCQWAGAYHLRTRLIKLAKTNGDILGFLV